LRLRIIGPLGSLDARSASGGRPAVTAALAARLRKKFRRVMGIGLLVVRLSLIAEKGVEGQSNADLLKCRRWQHLPDCGRMTAKEKSQFAVGRTTTQPLLYKATRWG
jgi:hypothetical protein